MVLVLSVVVVAAVCASVAMARQKTPTKTGKTNAGTITIQGPFFGVQNAFFGVIQKGAEAAAKQLGVKLVWTLAGQNFSVTAAADSMNTALAQKADVWMVVDVNPSAMDPIIKKAEAQGTAVIDINSGQNDPNRPYLFYIGQDEYKGGQLAGKTVWAASNGTLKRAVCFNQVIGDKTLELRCSGYKQALKAHHVAVDEIDVSGGPTQAYAKALAYLSAHKDVGAAYALTAGPEAFDPVIKALKKIGKAGGKIKFVANDLSSSALKQVAAGNALALIDQQQYLQGYMAVTWAWLYKKYDLVPGGDILTGPGLVTKANVAQVTQLVAQGYR